LPDMLQAQRPECAIRYVGTGVLRYGYAGMTREEFAIYRLAAFGL
jgi:hypothetical protein